MGLLAAAGYAVMSSAETRAAIGDSLAHGAWWLIVLACILPALNWILTSATFWALTGRFGRVGFADMAWAIGAAWVFNYLPLRPGMLGRFAYHKLVHDVRIRDSARVVIEAMLASAVGGAAMLGIALALPVGMATAVYVGVLAAPLVMGALVSATWWRRGSRGRVAMAITLRYAEMLVWMARYLIAFSLVGTSIDIRTAAIVTVVSQLAITIPISGNGLGVREWGVGLTTAALFAAGAIDAPDAAGATTLGLAADLVLRGTELIPALVIGGLSSAMIFRNTRRASRGR